LLSSSSIVFCTLGVVVEGEVVYVVGFEVLVLL